MLFMIVNLAKAAVGVIVETPVAVVADAVTMGSSTTNNQSYTSEALSKVVDNVQKATK